MHDLWLQRLLDHTLPELLIIRFFLEKHHFLVRLLLLLCAGYLLTWSCFKLFHLLVDGFCLEGRLFLLFQHVQIFLYVLFLLLGHLLKLGIQMTFILLLHRGHQIPFFAQVSQQDLIFTPQLKVQLINFFQQLVL